MSSSSQTSASRTAKDVAAEARKIAEQKKTSQSQKQQAQNQDKFHELTAANRFAQIMFNQSLSPEGKRDELVKALAFSKESSKEENRAKLDEFSAFQEYLQEQRKLLNKEGIKLQDTEAFAELQSVIDEMTKASIEFQEKAKPLLEVLNAVFEIRKNDKITDVYAEIQNDKAWLEEQEETLQTLRDELLKQKTQVDALNREAARLSSDRSLFGLGPVRELSRQRIAEIEKVEKIELTQSISQLVEDIKAQREKLAAGRESENPELEKQKAVLKEFLDLTKEENRDRQKALIDSAVNYVDTSDSRLKSVISTLSRLGKHAEVVSDSNGMLRNIHLIMDESLREVSAKNSDLRGTLASPTTDETSIARMTREEKLSELNEHITRTDEGAIDIANSIGGLSKHSVQIQAYKDTLRNETSSTKRLHLEGVSQMGEQLMSVISAISAAATSESRSIAANNFAKMAEQNQGIVSQEVVKNASNIELEANQIARLVGELQDYGEVLNASTGIANQGYERMRETVSAIKKVSGSVQSAINELISDRAEAGIAFGDETKDASPKVTEKLSSGLANPFDKLHKE